MDKAICLLTISLLAGMLSFGQNQWGVKGGVNLSNQIHNSKSTSPINPKALIGWQAGIFFKTKLNNRLSLAAEANILSVGAKYRYMKMDNSSGTPTERIFTLEKRIQYFEVPVTIQYKSSKFYFGAGPGVSLKLSSTPNENEAPPEYTTVDLSANGLVGYNLFSKVDINVRFSQRITNTIRNRNNYVSDLTVRNRFLNLSFLYKLR